MESSLTRMGSHVVRHVQTTLTSFTFRLGVRSRAFSCDISARENKTKLTATRSPLGRWIGTSDHPLIVPLTQQEEESHDACFRTDRPKDG